MPIMVNDMAKFYAARTTDQCHISVLGVPVLPAAFASSMISLSVLIQSFIFIATSAIADYGKLRKVMLLLTAFAGAFFTSCFIFLSEDKFYFIAGLLLVISNVFFGYSIVFYNAFLGPLVRSIPEYTEASTQEEKHHSFDQLTNKLSTRAFMIGYACGVFMTLLSIPIILFAPKRTNVEWYQCESGQVPTLKLDDDTTLAFRIAIFICGIWWIGLTMFSVVWLHPRPGPPLPPGKNYITASLGSVWKTLKAIRQLKNTFIFLIAYFLFSDAYTTISYVGILFAKNDVNASSFQLILLILETPLVALVGNFVFLWIKNRFHLQSKTVISLNLVILLILPTYAFIGFIPSSPIGMKQIWELYVFCGLYGLNVGAIQSFARTIFIQLTPPGHESEFFGFYEVTDKGSAWIGPAVVALLTSWTGQVRFSFIYLFLALAIPLIILKFVDVPNGIMQAKAFSEMENSAQMVEFGRLDTDEDDGLSGLSEEDGSTVRLQTDSLKHDEDDLLEDTEESVVGM